MIPKMEKSEEIEFNDELDLHHFSPKDTSLLVNYFLQDAHSRGLTRVKIIHGKGRSAKKREVRAILENNPIVGSFTDDGYNWGSTVVILAQKKDSE